MKLIVSTEHLIGDDCKPVFVGFDLSRAEILKAIAKYRKEHECPKKKQ